MDTIFDRLDREWPTLSTSRHSRTALHRWGTDNPALAGHRDLDGLVRHINRRHDPETSDNTLAALISVAAGEALAARTALQAMLPGLKALAASLQRFEDLDEITATITATCWQRIRCYPLDRRPSRVALNLLYDTRHQTIRRLRPTISTAPLPETQDQPSQTSASAGEDLIRLLAAAVAAGHLTMHEARLIGTTRLGDVTFRHLARTTGLREPALRQQRLRAERRLAQRAA